MSCGQLALERLGIEVDTYYASEIDKYAMQVTQANFPNTIHIGDVCNIKAEDYPNIDLILAGSPCQGFSFAGKQLAFDDPRSALFFEFIRLLKEIKPKYFLLENVKMKQQFQDVITEQVSACYPDFEGGDLLSGQIKPILINSALLSAQNRQRLYWTNIPNIEQPEDKEIVLKDILEDLPDKYTLMSSKFVNRNANKNCLINKTKNKASNLSAMEYVKNGRQGDYLACNKDGSPAEVLGGAIRGRYKEDGSTEQQLEINGLEKSNSLTTVQKDSLIVSTKPNQINPSKKAGGKQPYMQDRVFHKKGKSHALTESFASRTHVGEENNLSWRKLTPLECMRLQTVPDDYLMPVSNSQKYKLLGNGMTVDVIAHILNNMKL